MANVLAVRLLAARRRPRSRTFLQSFTLVGSSALLLVVVAVVLFPDVRAAYYNLGVIPMVAPLERRLPPGFLSVAVSVVSLDVVPGGPQLAVALRGGLFHQRYGIVRRDTPLADDADPLLAELREQSAGADLGARADSW